MPITDLKLVVFDMAGTTVRDNNEVLHCFRDACRQVGLTADDQRLNALMGVSKLEVFHILWNEHFQGNTSEAAVHEMAERSFHVFCEILEKHYQTQAVEPVDGVLEVFDWMRRNDLKIALNTGFYRKVTDIILGRLGWAPGGVIDFVIASDEVPQGRPAPFMIEKAMAAFGIADARQVVKIGDTPVDLKEGRNAGCRLSLGVVNGSHTREELAEVDHDGLLDSVRDLPAFLETQL